MLLSATDGSVKKDACICLSKSLKLADACSANARFLTCLQLSTKASTVSGKALPPPRTHYSQAFFASVAIKFFSNTVFKMTIGSTWRMKEANRESASLLLEDA